MVPMAARHYRTLCFLQYTSQVLQYVYTTDKYEGEIWICQQLTETSCVFLTNQVRVQNYCIVSEIVPEKVESHNSFPSFFVIYRWYVQCIDRQYMNTTLYKATGEAWTRKKDGFFVPYELHACKKGKREIFIWTIVQHGKLQQHQLLRPGLRRCHGKENYQTNFIQSECRLFKYGIPLKVAGFIGVSTQELQDLTDAELRPLLLRLTSPNQERLVQLVRDVRKSLILRYSATIY